MAQNTGIINATSGGLLSSDQRFWVHLEVKFVKNTIGRLLGSVFYQQI